MRTKQDIYNAHFKEIVEYCMIEKGQDPNICFNCTEALTKEKRQIHHLKYEGATIEDLRFGCNRCNMQPEYKGLT